MSRNPFYDVIYAYVAHKLLMLLLLRASLVSFGLSAPLLQYCNTLALKYGIYVTPERKDWFTSPKERLHRELSSTLTIKIFTCFLVV